MTRRLFPFLTIASIALAPVLGAQDIAALSPPALAGKARIVGVVVDSLNGGYLRGADIVIDAGRLEATTDSAGRFSIDGLSPGSYQVGVFHTLFDALGMTLVTRPFHVGADSTSVVIIGVPSPTTLVRRSCGNHTGPYGESAVIGRVVDPETLKPVERADVSVAWIEVEISKESGVHRNPHVLRDTTDASGAFAICGLPDSLQATLQAQRGSSSTAEIPITLGERPVEFLARTLFLPQAASAKTGSARVSGTVALENAHGNGGTKVELAGTGISTTTNDKGEFSLKNLPSGSRLLVVRHVGFVLQTVPVELSSREEQRVALTLPKFVEPMDPVLVVARRTAQLDKVGFTQRRKSGLGFYLGPERLSRMRTNNLTDILRQVPGLRVFGPNGEVIRSARGSDNCLQYYLDDMPYKEWLRGDVNRFVMSSEIVAVEVYPENLTPAEYVRAGTACTTILVWTRHRIRS